MFYTKKKIVGVFVGLVLGIGSGFVVHAMGKTHAECVANCSILADGGERRACEYGCFSLGNTFCETRTSDQSCKSCCQKRCEAAYANNPARQAKCRSGCEWGSNCSGKPTIPGIDDEDPDISDNPPIPPDEIDPVENPG